MAAHASLFSSIRSRLNFAAKMVPVTAIAQFVEQYDSYKNQLVNLIVYFVSKENIVIAECIPCLWAHPGKITVQTPLHDNTNLLIFLNLSIYMYIFLTCFTFAYLYDTTIISIRHLIYFCLHSSNKFGLARAIFLCFTTGRDFSDIRTSKSYYIPQSTFDVITYPSYTITVINEKPRISEHSK